MTSRKSDLEALRDRLKAEAAEAVGKDLAPLSRDLRAVLAELEQIPDAEGTAPADELLRKRQERRRQAKAREASG